MTALHWLTIAEVSRAFAARSLSPVELLSGLLDRIDKLDSHLHAFIRLDAEAAMDAARAAEKEIAAGRIRAHCTASLSASRISSTLLGCRRHVTRKSCWITSHGKMRR